MFDKLSVSWVMIALLAVITLIAVVVTAVAGTVVGLIVAVVLAIGAAFLVESALAKPLRMLVQLTAQLGRQTSSESEVPPTPSKALGHEIGQLQANIQTAQSAFRQRLTEIETIHAISQTITSSTLDYEKTVKSVLEAVQRVVDYDAAEVGVLRGGNLTVEAWWGKEDFKDTTGRKYRVGKGPTGTIAATKQPLFLPTIPADEDLKRTIAVITDESSGADFSLQSEFLQKTTKLVINSFLGIPLLISDRLIGTLTLVHHEDGHFTEDDMRQLNQLADHASIAIDNALEVRQREAALKQQIEDLKIEIDQAKLSTQVEEVTGSDFFKNLQDNAARMRERHNRDKENKANSESETNTESESAD